AETDETSRVTIGGLVSHQPIVDGQERAKEGYDAHIDVRSPQDYAIRELVGKTKSDLITLFDVVIFDLDTPTTLPEQAPHQASLTWDIPWDIAKPTSGDHTITFQKAASEDRELKVKVAEANAVEIKRTDAPELVYV